LLLSVGAGEGQDTNEGIVDAPSCLKCLKTVYRYTDCLYE
jgi:hypothetical protein